MSTKLTWEKIKSLYPDQWVELVDFEWDEFEPDPHSGIVRHHAKSRKEIHELYMKNPVDESAIIYTGRMKIKKGFNFSANLHQY